MKHPSKKSFAELTQRMSHFLDFPEVEGKIQHEIDVIVQKSLLSKETMGSTNFSALLDQYLNSPANPKERIKVVLALCGSSAEKMQRVMEALYPDNAWNNWSAKLGNPEIRAKVVDLLVSKAGVFEQSEVSVPPYILHGMQLPYNWITLLQDEAYLPSLVRRVHGAQYAVSMGFALEDRIVSAVERFGIRCEKGKVGIVDDKEVDLAIQGIENPDILVMSSYQLTTSSAQSTKAEGQSRMYSDIQTYNRRKRRRGQREILFINVIDGGGWLARSRDLERMWRECDYCFSADLAGFRDVLEWRYAPAEK